MTAAVINLRPATDHDAALRRAFAIVDHGIGEMWDAIIEWRLLALHVLTMEGRL